MNVITCERTRILINDEVGRRNSDVVGNYELVEDFPNLVVVVRHFGSLTDGRTEGITFDEDVGPLQADIPAMDVFIRIIGIRH